MFRVGTPTLRGGRGYPIGWGGVPLGVGVPTLEGENTYNKGQDSRMPKNKKIKKLTPKKVMSHFLKTGEIISRIEVLPLLGKRKSDL